MAHPTRSRSVLFETLAQLTAKRTFFAILDACDEPRVLEMTERLGDKSVSLYSGRARTEFASIAPYLVSVDTELLQWLNEELWETPWGILLAAQTDLETLRRHFRKYIIVEDPEGEELFFRFYDPRVLPTFLGSCNDDEAAQFFGPVDLFFCNSLDGIKAFGVSAAAFPAFPPLASSADVESY